MTIAWMVWAALVAVLAGAAASLLEPVLRGRGRAARGVWAGALVLSLGVPAAAWLAPSPASAPEAAAGVGLPLDLLLAMGGLASSPPPVLVRLDGWAVAAWAAASALLLLGLSGGLLRLALRARGWTRASLWGDEVLISRDFGPAVVGVGTARVVLPRWALALGRERLRMVLEHEREHGRAGDARLLLAGALALAAAPWNPALWWQVRRLRAAVEVDCDRRLLRRGVSPAAYGALLLELASRAPGLPFGAAGLVDPPSLLERRLKMIVRGARRSGPGRTATAVAGAGLLMAAACEAPPPTAVPPPAEAPVSGTVRVRGGAQPLVQPLVYVDGVRVEGVPEDLDPGRIDRVEVLKGRAAEAIQGPEAAGGVIRIFTKEGGASGSAETPGDGVAGVLRERVTTPAPAAGRVGRLSGTKR